MTNQLTSAIPEAGDDSSQPPFNPALIEGVLRALDKALRAHQLYEGNTNNPSYARAIDGARAAFGPVWAEGAGEFALAVENTRLTWHGAVVHAADEQAGDSLPWTLYKDGVRELTIRAGFEHGELDRFLDLLQRARRAQALDDDLLTMLWEAEFDYLSYRNVELAFDGTTIDPSAEPGRWPVSPGAPVDSLGNAIAEARAGREDDGGATGGGDSAAEAVAPPSGVVRMEDFDSSLYFLEEEEVRYLKEELDREYKADLRRVVLDALLDIFEVQADPLVRGQVVDHIEALILHLLAGRQFANVAYLLRETKAVAQRVRDVQPATLQRVAGLSDRLSEPAALGQLLQAMDESQSLPPRDEIEGLFLEFKPSALGVVFAWLGQAKKADLRALLEGAAGRLAASNTGELVRLLASHDPAIAVEAARRAGALRTPAAVGALGKLLAEADREVRIVAVTALADIGTPGAMQVLERAVEDHDRDVRVAVLRALAARAHRPALPRITAAVKSGAIRDADRTERVALFELFGLLCGDGGVPYLDELLTAKGGLFSRKEDPELRACAAVALGKVRTPRAREALQKAVGEKDVIVRNAVARALREAGD
ncbi:MAG: HEAT repeat domain-containing protein [Gemmatimonadaceae bacterium]|nr:HEAT repeat domain-containing protein [Gemmatimonadaceae bacterium]